jgi:exopolysaccharide production protein ExoZ
MNTGSAPTPRQNFSGVQFLRFFSAMLVVLTHSTGSIAERMLGTGYDDYWRGGMVGVHTFFVISGFVMMVSTASLARRENAAAYFLKMRVIRVVPMYWAATTAKIAASLLLPKLAAGTSLAVGFLACSYLFIPVRNGNGDLLPVLTVGWTLAFEMFFYLLFSLALYLRVSPFRFVNAIFFAMLLLGVFWKPPHDALAFFFSPLLLDFTLGMIIGLGVQRGICLPVPVCVAVIVVATVLLFGLDHAALGMPFFTSALPAMLLVGGFVFGDAAISRFLPALLPRLGDSSYSLYLSHPFVVPAVTVILVKLGMNDPLVALLIIAIASVVIGHLIYLLIERHLLEFLKKRWLR